MVPCNVVLKIKYSLQVMNMFEESFEMMNTYLMSDPFEAWLHSALYVYI